MEKKTCEHLIGMIFDYDDTRLVSLDDLQEHITHQRYLYDNRWISKKAYTLSDYADKRKSTDMSRFEYCPICGEKIDWKKIKEGVANEQFT